MKIGIMTYWWAEDNYGQILQCYALQKFLHDRGYDVYLIRYDPRNDRKTPFWKKIIKAFNPVELHKFLRFKISGILESRYNSRGFDVFRNRHIKQSEKIYHSYNELVNDPPMADIYIVGSDQVWNTYGVPIDKAITEMRAYLLDFGHPLIKRISYAASFGREGLDAASIELFASQLQKFSYVSVREESGLNICKKCGIDNAEWVPDPTMLLDVSLYRSLYENETIKEQSRPYCLFYFLGNESKFSIQSVYDWASTKNIEVIYVTGNSYRDRYVKTYATISKWLNLIDRAEYIITNSYHASIFALLFQKKFGIIPLEGKDIGMNSRFESLFQLFEIENRFIDPNFCIIDNEINWHLVSDTFQKLRSECKLVDILKE